MRRMQGRNRPLNTDNHSEIESQLANSTFDANWLESLHSRLELAAAEADLLDVAYTTIDSPVGKLLLAATSRGVVRVAFEVEGHDQVLDTLARQLSPRVLRSPRKLDQLQRMMDEYFASERTRFDVDLDFSLSRGFRRTVQESLSEIDYGHTLSYAQVAQEVDNPRAVRAVGTACATNPLPVVVPCHRVVRSDGQAGSYVGGIEAKSFLLRLERVALGDHNAE